MKGKLMKKTNILILISLFYVIIPGCSTVKTHKIIIFGQDHSGSNKLEGTFSEACRAVLKQFGSLYSQTSKEFHLNSIASYKATYKVRDEQSYEYIIYVKGKSKNKLIVTLKTTNPDEEKFINTVYDEFNERGFKVERAYND